MPLPAKYYKDIQIQKTDDGYEAMIYFDHTTREKMTGTNSCGQRFLGLTANKARKALIDMFDETMLLANSEVIQVGRFVDAWGKWSAI